MTRVMRQLHPDSKAPNAQGAFFVSLILICKTKITPRQLTWRGYLIFFFKNGHHYESYSEQ